MLAGALEDTNHSVRAQALRYLDAAAGDPDPQIRALVQAPAGPAIDRSGSPLEIDR